MPWGDQTYIGTTDTDYDGPLDDPQCTPDGRRLPARRRQPRHHRGAHRRRHRRHLGRPAPAGQDGGTERTADLSRRHVVALSASGVVTVTGGKLTTYRKMAADTVDVVVRLLGSRGQALAHQEAPPPRRRRAGRRCAAPGAAAPPRRSAPATLDHLVGRYGGEAPRVLSLVSRTTRLGEPLVPGLPYLRAEAVYAVRYEMATTLDDILSRRTRAGCWPATPPPRRPTRWPAWWPPSSAGTGRDAPPGRTFRSATEREREAVGSSPERRPPTRASCPTTRPLGDRCRGPHSGPTTGRA